MSRQSCTTTRRVGTLRACRRSTSTRRGPPCQPWSREDLGRGRHDKHGRGRIVDYVAAYIDTHLPKASLLENAASLTVKNHKQAFDGMLASLRRSGRYVVSWRVLSASDSAIPQNRPRVYILGLF